MATDDEIHTPILSSAVLQTKTSTNKKIQPVSLNCEVCNIYGKPSTTEEIQSPGLSCEDCECKELLTSISAHEEVQSEKSSIELCNALLARASTNEKNEPSCLSCEDCECKVLTSVLPLKGSTYDEIQLASVAFSSEALPKKHLSDESESLGDEKYIAGEMLYRKLSTDHKIQSRSWACEALPKKMSNESRSKSSETCTCSEELFTKVLSDEDVYSRCMGCEALLSKMSTDNSNSSCFDVRTESGIDSPAAYVFISTK